MPQVVKLAHESKTKVLLSVGGWTGSKRFSPMVASPQSRKAFIDWNLDFIEKYHTDGVDLDWEYPGKQAAGCNEFADNDADNFLLLLKELRHALDLKFPDEHKEISMAVHVQPFIRSGIPMTDLKAFVPYFDHVNLMTYGKKKFVCVCVFIYFLSLNKLQRYQWRLGFHHGSQCPFPS